MDVLEVGGTMVRPGAPLLVGPGGWVWGICIPGRTVAVDAASGGAGRGGAGGSAWFVREREREEERETTLRTRSRRLPVEEDGVRGRVLPFTPRVFFDTGVGVGIPLSVSGTGGWLRLINEVGRLRPFSSVTGTAAVESRSLWKEPV